MIISVYRFVLPLEVKAEVGGSIVLHPSLEELHNDGFNCYKFLHPGKKRPMQTNTPCSFEWV